MAMSGMLYKRATNEDENPLPLHDDEDGNGDIEMNDFEQDESRIHDFTLERPSVAPQMMYKSKRREICYFLWAVTITILFLITIIIAIAVHKSDRDIHWCCINDDELAKCNNMSLAFNMEKFKPRFTCISGVTLDDCVHKINMDVADVMSMSNLDLYNHSAILRPIMAEDHHTTPGEYGSYIVAVASKDSKKINLTHDGLLNSRICAMQSVVKLVFGFMSVQKIISPSLCKTHVGCLFIQPIENLGRGCLQSNVSLVQSPKECESLDPSISFMDHLSMNDSWTASSASKYELLCLDGTRAKLTDYKTCNLLWQPPKSLVVSSKERSDQDIFVPSNIVEVLHIAQLYYGPHGKEWFKLFTSNGKKKNLLFQDTTDKLLPLQTNCTTQNYLGVDFMRYMNASECVPISRASHQTCFLPQYD